jgi:hypothetical protein
MNGYVMHAPEGGFLPAGDGRGPVPAWLSLGTARNLRRAMRAEDTEIANRARKQGRLPGPADLLGMSHGDADPVTRAGCGLLVSWILSQPDRSGVMEDAFGRLAGGSSLTVDWLLGILPTCETVADLDAAWDEWVLRQRRTVYRPGTIREDTLDLLRAELLIHPGDFGIAQPEADEARPLRLRDLIAQRGAGWLQAAVENKLARLRLLAVGRGEALLDVTERYCAFLEGVAAGEGAEELNALLREAEQALEDLERSLQASSGEETGP